MTFDDLDADVVKSREDKILVRVPAEGLEAGAVTIDHRTKPPLTSRRSRPARPSSCT